MQFLLRRNLILTLIACLLLSACGAPAAATSQPTTAPGGAANATVVIPPTVTPGAKTANVENNTPAQATDTPAAVAAAPTATSIPPTPAAPVAANTNYVLAFNNNTGSVVRYTQDGQGADMVKASGGKPLAYLCAAAPTGKVTLFTGIESKGAQGIYNPDGTLVQALDDNSGLACSLTGGIQVSPNQSRLGVVQYGPDAAGKTFLLGKLSIRDLGAAKEVAKFDSVTAYQLQDDGVLYLQFFTNDKGEANQADLMWWDGSKSRPVQREIASLQDCQFTSGRVLHLGDKAYSLFGEKCKNKGTSWRLMRTDFAGGNSTNIASGQAGGDYFTKTGTNGIWALPDGSALLIAVPHGLSQEVGVLLRVNLSDNSVSTVIGSVVLDLHPQNPPRRFVFSPAGDRLAVVTRDGNGGEALYVLNLANLGNASDLTPLAGGKRSDRVGALAWTADGGRLYYVISGDLNGLYYQTFSGASERNLVVRGMFQGLAITENGAMAAVAEVNPVAANDVRYNLVWVSVDSLEKTVVIEGKKDERPIVPLLMR